MNIFKNINYDIDIDKIKQMIFIYNALDNGWNIKKNKDSYIFTKRHHNQREIFEENYLADFIDKNSNLNKILVNLKKEIN